MKRFKAFAALHPVLFVMIFVFISVLLVVIAYSWGELFPCSELSQYIGQSITQLVSTLCFILILWRFGWLRASGFTSIGRVQTWLLISLPFLYVLAKDVYLITGEFSFGPSNPTLTFWLGLSSLTTGLFEETVFRGVVLFSFLRLWEHSRSGMTKSISVSALLFGGIHVLRLAENSVPQTLLTMFTAVLIGFFYGVILLHGGSIWIPIVFHSLHNAVLNLIMAGKNAVETALESFFILLTTIPAFLLGIYLLKKIPQNWENTD
ncbi:MAG: CPBP family intramembrane metalloprotease [Candidatus Aminicenantes bacterium]|nr:MAG: CPBP family intramembrane metalloprotease [Candidatus Aminicenantes bacterium]